ncbi:g12727 [Coccomyxa viridis]|uniref:G12727 protein n=1 Tax=Coccomyxa viridis TaxID=1274662 RepID=A0ABP1GI32_9CHLO
MSRTALVPIRDIFRASFGASSRWSPMHLQTVSFASESSEPTEAGIEHKEDFIPHPMPEVPANIRENLEDEKWPHASDEERRSDMGRPEEAEMPTQFSPTPDPQPDETPERKPTK